jgi:hypothetical protein
MHKRTKGLAIILLLGGLSSPGAADTSLPALVKAEIANIERECATTGSPFKPTKDFVQIHDLNEDGQPDYLIDTARIGCLSFCGARACVVTLFYSAGSTFLRKDFLGGNMTFEDFRCGPDGCDWR